MAFSDVSTRKVYKTAGAFDSVLSIDSAEAAIGLLKSRGVDKNDVLLFRRGIKEIARHSHKLLLWKGCV
jgi:hypothetical protein